MSKTNEMPKEEGIDHSINLLREGYMFITNRRGKFHSEVFETHLLGQKAICLGGKEAAEIFYDPEKFKRMGAAPKRAKETLFGKNGVQGLDGEQHRHRKNLFMSLMSPEQIDLLIDITKKQWEMTVMQWEQMEQVILYEETKKLLCNIACEWAGLPVPAEESERLPKDLGNMFESAGRLGPPHWKGRMARNHVENWVGKVINDVREGKVTPPENSALYRISFHRNLTGNLMDTETAAVEVLNILRPIVAVSVFINFIALAVFQYPEETEKLRNEDEKFAMMFVQEVRRFYPFFPFVVARVNKNFTWKDYDFEEDTLTLLDLYGTNHDPNTWDQPDVFNPERFKTWDGSPFSFIPQGGGDYYTGHRCAGEWITLELMKVSLDFLANKLQYEIPDQDLSYSLVKIPSIPHSKVILNDVTRKK